MQNVESIYDSYRSDQPYFITLKVDVVIEIIALLFVFGNDSYRSDQHYFITQVDVVIEIITLLFVLEMIAVIRSSEVHYGRVSDSENLILRPDTDMDTATVIVTDKRGFGAARYHLPNGLSYVKPINHSHRYLGLLFEMRLRSNKIVTLLG